MKTKTEIRDWLLENAVSVHGNLQLSGLDFGDFDGNVFINDMIVKRSLYQSKQTVGGVLNQSYQTAGGDLYQSYQTVKGSLYQSDQNVGSDLSQNRQTVGGERYEYINKTIADNLSNVLEAINLIGKITAERYKER